VLAMATIDVDFEVFKELTVRRTTEDVTYNDVLRDLLKLRKKADHPEKTHLGVRGAIFKGVNFPDGTRFQATYKGARYVAQIRNSKWVDGATGQIRNSPSSAASMITGNTVNGWRFWSCQRPGELEWTLLDKLQP
jgi:hypothetical protein